MLTTRIASLSALMALPSVAWGSDFSGIYTIMYLLFVIAPLLVVHLIVTLTSLLRGRYASRSFAIGHSIIASVAPGLGFLWAMFEFRPSWDGDQSARMFVALVIYAPLLLISWIPMAIHKFKVREAQT